MSRKRLLQFALTFLILWQNGCSLAVSHYPIDPDEVSDYEEVRVMRVYTRASHVCPRSPCDGPYHWDGSYEYRWKDSVWTNITDARIEGDIIRGYSSEGFNLSIPMGEVHQIEKVARGDPTMPIAIGAGVVLALVIVSVCGAWDGEPNAECRE